MDVNELLVRTMNASKEAQENGFYETADALGEILDGLLEMLCSRAQLGSEASVVVPLELQHLH